jgi:hypothetical protein
MSDSGGDETPDRTMADRVPAGRVKSWVLMDGNRRTVAFTLLMAVFLALVALGTVWPSSVRGALESGDPIETLFQAMVGAIITGVTLVVTINQLVLAQELGPVGDQRERMEGSLSFRSDVAEYLDEPVSPADPAAFLAALLSTVRDRALALETGTTGAAGDDASAEVASFASQTAAEADHAESRLADAEFGTFAVIRVALDFNYSFKIYEGKRLGETRAGALSADGERALADLLDALGLFGVAREHFKTLYFQWELIALSRVILYAAVPALATAMAMILFFEGPTSLPGTTFGIENALWVVTAATLVSLVPFLLFIAYILRIVTVAKRTLAIGPFVLRETDDRVTVDGEREDRND